MQNVTNHAVIQNAVIPCTCMQLAMRVRTTTSGMTELSSPQLLASWQPSIQSAFAAAASPVQHYLLWQQTAECAMPQPHAPWPAENKIVSGWSALQTSNHMLASWVQAL